MMTFVSYEYYVSAAKTSSATHASYNTYIPTYLWHNTLSCMCVKTHVISGVRISVYLNIHKHVSGTHLNENMYVKCSRLVNSTMITNISSPSRWVIAFSVLMIVGFHRQIHFAFSLNMYGLCHFETGTLVALSSTCCELKWMQFCVMTLIDHSLAFGIHR